MIPVGQRLVVKVLDPESYPTQTEAGIILPPKGKRAANQAVVMRVGEDVKTKVNVGDRIWFQEGTAIQLNPEDEFSLIHELNVLAILADS